MGTKCGFRQHRPELRGLNAEVYVTRCRFGILYQNKPKTAWLTEACEMKLCFVATSKDQAGQGSSFSESKMFSRMYRPEYVLGVTLVPL